MRPRKQKHRDGDMPTGWWVVPAVIVSAFFWVVVYLLFFADWGLPG